MAKDKMWNGIGWYGFIGPTTPTTEISLCSYELLQKMPTLYVLTKPNSQTTDYHMTAFLFYLDTTSWHHNSCRNFGISCLNMFLNGHALGVKNTPKH